jgi:hypothetical protein
MTATNDEIRAEARRRLAAADPDYDQRGFVNAVIEVTREGWTPPEPVDPDVLAFEQWFKGAFSARPDFKEPYLAGARMAREQEQERAKVLVEYVRAREQAGSPFATEALDAYKAGRAAR